MISAIVLLVAVLLDALIGEPPVALHPVVWMGTVIAWAKAHLPRSKPWVAFLSGAFLALFLPFSVAIGSAFLLWALEPWPIVYVGVSIWLLWSAFAIRLLWEAGRRVKFALVLKDLDAARAGLSWLCSRKADDLTEEEVAAAAVESLAENLSDSVVAPLFWFAVLGIPGVLFYRVVNTLDAMIGYHGEMEHFGKTAARLDDLLNYLPARFTAQLLIVAGAIHRYDYSSGIRILFRDGHKTESPNAGRPMAAMAGLLGIQLSKKGHYDLGDAKNVVSPGTLSQAQQLLLTSAGLTVFLVLLTMKPWTFL